MGEKYGYVRVKVEPMTMTMEEIALTPQERNKALARAAKEKSPFLGFGHELQERMSDIAGKKFAAMRSDANCFGLSADDYAWIESVDKSHKKALADFTAAFVKKHTIS